MGLLERIAAYRKPAATNAWPVGKGSVLLGDRFLGHDDSLFVPEEYGDYLVTSNEIYSAATLRARLMSRLPLRLYRGRDKDKALVTSGGAADLLRRVNPFWTPARLTRMDELSMCIWGESHWVVEKRGRTPVELWWVKSSRMTPLPHENEYLSGWLYESVTGEQIPFRADEVIWFRYPNPLDEFSALSPISAARLAADTGSAMMQSNRNLFRNGLQLGGLVVPDTDKVSFTVDQARDLEEDLARRFKGVDKAHRWAVLRYEAQLKGVGVNPKDAEFLGGLGVTLRQVCNAFGIPASLLGERQSSTQSSLEVDTTLMWQHGLVPDAELRANEIEEQLLPMFAGRRGEPDHCAYDYSSVDALQAAQAALWAQERQAIEIGRKTINEVRRARGEPDVAWGDVWWAPVNKSAVADANSRPQGDTSPTEMPDDTSGSDSDPGRPPAGQEDPDRDLARLLDPSLWAIPALNGRHHD